MARNKEIPNQDELDEEDRLLEDDLFIEDLEEEDDPDSGDAKEEEPSFLDLAVDLFRDILATEGRLTKGRFSPHVGKKGEYVDGTGIYISFEELEKGDNEDQWALLNAIETRAVQIALALKPDLFGARSFEDSLRDGQNFNMGTRDLPDLSAHERLLKTAELRQRLIDAGHADADISALLAGPEVGSVARPTSGEAPPLNTYEDWATLLGLYQPIGETVALALASDPRFTGGKVGFNVYSAPNPPSMDVAPKHASWDTIAGRALELVRALHGADEIDAYAIRFAQGQNSVACVWHSTLPAASNHAGLEAWGTLSRRLAAADRNPADYLVGTA